ncbi:MAG: hypothetical protein ACR5LA_12970, partial [Wolbachia sp.]
LGSSFLIENVVLFAINFAGCQCQALTVCCKLTFTLAAILNGYIFVHQSSSVIKVAGTGSFMTAVPRDVIPVLDTGIQKN